MKKTLIIFLLIYTSFSQAAYFMDSAELKELLIDFDAYQENREIRYMAKASQYVGYVTGVVDSLDGSRFCLTKGVSAEHASGIVSKYLRDHPDGLDRHASEIISTVLAASFPCRR
ncbi:hypothetical protein F6R98_08330 [Candidatus Methylospira mobilis]|uniref:Rap1a immunity protein domain-containing protein n=1 Tax=Candidatus Methylospira mobilis TaxID=1808979 RepID=A0A5Q0BKI0_9GAMM|nr:Rap1a/Tai family immunity protein [Candidatus Methylospira mobilis]QFY42627.1 hypothetical protein F6R98_08330 [Candidatus Methylospira mobilis]WNV04256.1 Rap1a/Tai family immunity protein [Candidatus Methylospira mobilis]